jgi:hypothetical protein
MTELFSGLAAPDWFRSSNGLWLPLTAEVQSWPREMEDRRFKGLLIAERREVLPGVAAFATPEFVGQGRLEMDGLLDLIQRLPQETWLLAISALQARLWAIQADFDRNFDLATEVFSGTPAWPGIKAFLQNGTGVRVPFSEQGLTLLQWLVVIGGSEAPLKADLNRKEWGVLRSGLLAVASHVDVQGDRALGDEPEHWLYYLTQNFAFNAKPMISNAIGRTWRIYGCLARELGEGDVPSYAPIDAWFAKDYGLSLEQQLALGFGLHSHLGIAAAEEHGGRHPIAVDRGVFEDLFDRLGLTGSQRERAADLISAPLAWFQDQVSRTTVDGASWDQVPMMRRPFLRLDDGRYLLLTPRGLESWFSDGIFYRGLDCAHRRGEKAVADYTAYVGHLTEAYVLQMTMSVHPEPRLPHVGKVHGDKQFGSGVHSSDVTITYPNELALIEVSSRRLTVKSRRDGDPDALRMDLREIAGRRVGQLHRSIEAVKPRLAGVRPALRYPEVAPERLARIWPLVVTAIPLTWTPQLGDFLKEENPGALERDDVESLDVLALEDFEALLAIVERTGRRLVDLLRAKREVAGSHADVRRWLSRDRATPNFGQPGYVSTAFDEACDEIQVALGFAPGEDEVLDRSA